MSDTTRIESLETQVRTLKRMLFGVFGLVVIGGLLAATSMQSVPDVIQAKKFEVVNDEGEVRGRIYVLDGLEPGEDGGARLQMHNKDGLSVIDISAGSSSGSLNFFNHEGKNVVSLSTASAGGKLRMRNNEGKLGAELRAGGSGGLLEIRNGNGQGVAAIGAKSGAGIISVVNLNGEITALPNPKTSD